LTLTKTYSENARKKFALAMTTQSLLPPPANADILIGGGPPGDFDFHTTGLAFDILPPKEPLQRKTLENALGWLSDRHILWWREEKDKAGLRYHAVPNPRYAADLAHHL
jgi:hypothetical protein